jgi:hypothetical protein
MKKRVNSILFRSILETEFFLLSSNLKKKINNSNLGISSNRRGTYGLDMFELVKNLKQLIRILQFLNEQKAKSLVLCSSNKSVIGFLHLYHKELNLEGFVTIQNDYTRVDSTSKSTPALLLFEESLKNNLGGLSKLLEKNVLLISKINSKIELKNFGTYKTYNDVSNYKKLAFVVTLLHQVFIQKNIIKS